MTAPRLFVILTAIFASLAVWFVPRMDASGDEPHYLVMAQSLWREHDLDLRDNYEREDWREFRGGPTRPHYAAPRRDGTPFPGHAPGLPFLLAPIYAAGGRLACVALLGAMVGAVGALAFWIAAREGSSAGAALLAGVLAAGPPLAAFALHVYTEAPAALALLAAYALLRFGPSDWGAGLAAALACALPFLHPRMAAGSLAIAFAAVVFRDRISLRWFGSVTGLGALAYGLFWTGVYGSPTALAAYGGIPEDTSLHPGRALVGLLIDRAYGLVPVAPAFVGLLVLGRAAAPGAAGEERWRRVEWAFVAAVVLPVLFWRMWWGGQSPPARLVAPMVPFLALWLARRWEGAAACLRAGIVAAAIWSWALFVFAASQPGRLLFINRRVRPTRLWDALWPGGPLDRLLPDLVRPESSDWGLAAIWLIALTLFVVVARRARTGVATSRAGAG